MGCNWEKVALGEHGQMVSPIGLASSYGIGAADVERAYERGINYFYWGSVQRPDFGKAVRKIGARDREKIAIVVQSYTRVGFLMKTALESALRSLDTDYCDILLLGWWNKLPPRRILDAAQALKDAGRARSVMISCHERTVFKDFIAAPEIDSIMVRYNAAHPGAEEEVFPFLNRRRVGVVAYTATRWGSLLDPKYCPPGEKTPSAADCYRFPLTNPNVDVVLAGPKDAAELDGALAALDRGPMTPDELAWMKRVGKSVREHHKQPWLARLVSDMRSG